MSFRDLEIPIDVKTTADKPARNFFEPLLRQAVRFDVAIGYFTSSWMSHVAEGFSDFASRGGKCNWIVSPQLNEKDWAILKDASPHQQSELVNTKLYEDAAALCEMLRDEPRIALSWLIRDGFINLKVGITDRELGGMLHTKIGIFEDQEGNRVAFSGSYNLTSNAENNWETIDVYASFRAGDVTRVDRKLRDLSAMWSNRDPNLKLFDPTDRAIEPFMVVTREYPRPTNHLLPHRVVPKVPNKFLSDDGKLRAHQEAAIREWFKANGRGIFNMATGSGKTVTALTLAVRLNDHLERKGYSLFVLVLVPYKHLAEQWRVESRDFGFEPLMCFSDYPDWRNSLSRAIADLKGGNTKLAFCIVVNDSFAGADFQHFLERVDCNFLLIADEMHNLGTVTLQNSLPEAAGFRVGLSATPVRHRDKDGTEFLRSYFGEEAINYGIEEAIEDGTLSPYYYFPNLVELSDEEWDEYEELSIKIARLSASDEESSAQLLERLMLKRARVVANGENKVPKLVEQLASQREVRKCLIYVGDGQYDGARVVDQVTSELNEMGLRAARFTAGESLVRRGEILQAFKDEEIDVIVAIRCLDEGVDVPSTETAFIIASSSNPRQFIQRRGRVLRLARGKTHANIHDFIVVPPRTSSGNAERVEEIAISMIKRELDRVREFAQTALNGPAAIVALEQELQKYGIDYI